MKKKEENIREQKRKEKKNTKKGKKRGKNLHLLRSTGKKSTAFSPLVKEEQQGEEEETIPICNSMRGFENPRTPSWSWAFRKMHVLPFPSVSSSTTRFPQMLVPNHGRALTKTIVCLTQPGKSLHDRLICSVINRRRNHSQRTKEKRRLAGPHESARRIIYSKFICGKICLNLPALETQH